MAPPGILRGRSLLAIFAHPDDESLACGGLLALCADAGMRVSLLCATTGEDGPDSMRSSEPLGARRARELSTAAGVLGVQSVTVLGFADGMLPWIEGDDLVRRIGEELARIAPDIVVTFDEDGLYWHPDHIAIHHATRAAVAASGAVAPALYYVSMPPGRMRALVESVRSRLDQHDGVSILGVEDVDAIGALAPEPTLVLNVETVAPRKLAALLRHETQTRGGPLSVMTDDEAVRYLGVEHLRRASFGNTTEPFLEHLNDRI